MIQNTSLIIALQNDLHRVYIEFDALKIQNTSLYILYRMIFTEFTLKLMQ